jgi:hypothetical protein
MEFLSNSAGISLRVLALISLALGLNDCSRLLGVTMADTSPIALLGPTGFTLLAIFALTRLFAAVGLWMKASWGAVLLIASTGTELALYLLGNPDVHLSGVGFGVRLVLLLAILGILLLAFRLRFSRVQD